MATSPPDNPAARSSYVFPAWITHSAVVQAQKFPEAISGLLQLLPPGKESLAKKPGIKGVLRQLLNPSVNLGLGTANLKQVSPCFGRPVEYALAGYNTGDTPTGQRLCSSNHRDGPELVETIPYWKTRDYVQAILRSREMCCALYPAW
ncbi:MAG: transglycosylase SLT domain-containing protein [Granulicella sp.]